LAFPWEGEINVRHFGGSERVARSKEKKQDTFKNTTILYQQTQPPLFLSTLKLWANLSATIARLTGTSSNQTPAPAHAHAHSTTTSTANLSGLPLPPLLKVGFFDQKRISDEREHGSNLKRKV